MGTVIVIQRRTTGLRGTSYSLRSCKWPVLYDVRWTWWSGMDWKKTRQGLPEDTGRLIYRGYEKSCLSCRRKRRIPSGKIDLIITKSVSRFARNTVDSLTTIRKLKEKGTAEWAFSQTKLSADAGTARKCGTPTTSTGRSSTAATGSTAKRILPVTHRIWLRKKSRRCSLRHWTPWLMRRRKP